MKASIGDIITCKRCKFSWETKTKTVKKCKSCGSKYFNCEEYSDLQGECWKIISQYEAYSVSNYGRIKRTKMGKGSYPGSICFGTINHDGYVRVNLGGRLIFAHVVIAHEFIGPKPLGHECNHKDGNKQNNHVSNLEYVTHHRNMIHAKETGLMAYGDRSGSAKIKEKDIQSILLLKRSGVNQPTMAKMFDLDQSCISRIVNGHNWKRTVAKYANL